MGLILAMIQTLALMGFAPDMSAMIRPADGGGEAHFVECDGFYPTLRGYRRTPSPVETYGVLPTRVSPADDGSCYGAYVARFLDGSTKLFAGTKTALYRGAAGSWTHYSTLADFNTDDRGRWRFAMFGNDCIAVNGQSSPQIITDTGSGFAALAGLPPTAKVVAVVNPGGSGAFVFLLNLSSTVPSNALTPSMWWCSGIGDDTEWTPGTDTQSANGYLNETPGEILGAKALGRNLIIYKEKSIYVGEYAGPPTIWDMRLTSSESGALSHEAVVDLGDAHATMGFDNFYLVDGSGSPREIESGLRRFLFQDNGTGHGDLDRNRQFAVQGRYDRAAQVVYWHYPSIAIDADTIPQLCDSWVAWHRQSGRWTKGLLDVEQVVYPELPGSSGLTYGDFGSLFTTWGQADDVTYDSYLFAGSSDVVPAIIGSDHKLYSLNGLPAAGGYFTLGDYGDGQTMWFVRRHRPQFSIYPANVGTYLENTMRDNLGSTETFVGATAYLDTSPGWVNFRNTRRFHRWKYVFPEGDAEIETIDVDVLPMGRR